MRLMLVFLTILILLFPASVFAQIVEPDPINPEDYSTVITWENAAQLEIIAVKVFPEYFAVHQIATDASGRIVGGWGQQLETDFYWISVWDMLTNEVYKFDPVQGLEYDPRLCCHEQEIAISPDGTKIAAAVLGMPDDATVIRMWDIKTGELLISDIFDSRYSHGAVEFSPDGQFLVASVPGMSWWNVETGVLVNSISLFDYDLVRTESDSAPPSYIRDSHITPDNLLYFAQGGGVFVWNLETNQLINSFIMSGFARDPDAPADAVKKGFPTYPPVDNDKIIHSLSVSPDGHFIATGHKDGVRMWDTQSDVWQLSREHWDKAITSIDTVNWIASVAFNHTGDILFAVDNKTLNVINLDSYEILPQYYDQRQVFTQVAINEDGTLVFLSPIHPEIPETGIAVFAVR